jgi:hypothetical protein
MMKEFRVVEPGGKAITLVVLITRCGGDASAFDSRCSIFIGMLDAPLAFHYQIGDCQGTAKGQ